MNGSEPEPATIELHCVCGGRRVVPAGLRIVSCVKCGRALGPPLPDPGPAIFLLAVATNVTQLVSGIALGLAIAAMRNEVAVQPRPGLTVLGSVGQ